jgi:predicted transcriptional regulator
MTAESVQENLLSQVRRSPIEMVCDVLGVLSDGPKRPTHILYKANMSWRVLSSYLDYLVEKGMVEKDNDEGKRMVYRLTERGRSILDRYDDLRLSLTGGKVSGTRNPRAELRQQQSSWPWL